MITLLAGALIAAAIAWSANALITDARSARAEARAARMLTIMQMFAPALAAAQHDPRVFLVWQPIARAARAACPEEFAALDRVLGDSFPFSIRQLEAAHAQWTSDWLAWELTHDREYKLKAAEAEQRLRTEQPSLLRAQLDAIEREKLDLYQRRYEEYVRVSKAFQALAGG
jgi:hypothetical protein